MFQVEEPHDKIIVAFLAIRPVPTDPQGWVSTLSAVMRDARSASGRNIETGVVEDAAKAGNWVGTVGYLIMLDQVSGNASRRYRYRAPRGTRYR